ncbi:Mastermind-like protein 2 [Tupaia chinensis]|uniref:Mastermind-like protein 2 n=1 Tax=Tupaia chinensis TaxID=246437 RepID=L8YAW1_TUPCH|nr:Mastermind-like protein 2 [Tupaia chinensis]
MDTQMIQENIFSNRYGDDPGEQLMDPELQELFNELTNISVPPMSDLELENMINATIKQDDPFNIDLGQQNQRSTPRPSLPMEKIVIKSEYSPGLTQGPSSSPQLRPPSAGPTFSMTNSALSTSSPIPSVPQSQAQPQTASGTGRTLPSWQEVSHAQQLKQIAANRQQHARMQQHQQQHQPANWPALPSSAGPSPGGSSTVSLNSNQALANPVSTHTILTPNSSLMSTSHGTRMPSLSTTVQNLGMYGNLPCNQPGTYSVTSGINQLTQQRNPNQLIANQNNPLMPRPPTLGPSNNSNVANFGAGSVGNSQLRPNLIHSMASMPAQRTSNVMITTNTTAPNWASQEATTKQQEVLKSTAVRFSTATPTAYTPNQSLQQAVGSQQFSQRTVAPPNQLTPAVQMRPMNQMNQTLNGQTMGPLRGLSLRPNQLSTPILPNLNQSGTGLNQSRTNISQPPSLTASNFPSPNQSTRAFQGTDHGSDLAFDFLNQQTDNMGPALNSDADFIDSLLKTEPGNDDWMKDINLDEILGNNS